MRWALVIGLCFFIVTLLLPLIFAMPVRLQFNSSSEGIDVQEEVEAGEFLPGAISEERETTLSTRYNAVFIPMRLSEYKSPMIAMHGFFCPHLITGAPIILVPDASTRESGMSGEAVYRLSSFMGPVMFYFLLVLFLLASHLLMRNLRSIFRLVVSVGLIWFGWSVLLFLSGHWLTRTMNDLLNEILTSGQGHGNFEPLPFNAFEPTGRVLLVGMLYWFIAYAMEKSKSEQPKLGVDKSLHPRPD